jgi:predicted metal-dependent phosphoesterase TrpH
MENHPAIYDLHLHTRWSYDATTRAESHFLRARGLGVKWIAVTDHHVVDSLPEVLEAATRYPDVSAIPSAELTVTTSIGAVDLLCYGLPLETPPALRAVLEAYHAWQRACGRAVSEGLQALGYPFTDDERLSLLRTYRPEKAVRLQGNTHVKAARMRDYCIERGFAADADACADLLARARKRVPPPPYPKVTDVVPPVKAAGAVVAIAHPHGYFNACDHRRMDALREECGLDGVECAHSAVPAEFTGRYRDYCVRYGLFSTGGSDCHSEEDVAGKFGRHGGADGWLEEFLERLGRR